MPQGMGLGFSSGAERIAEAAAKIKAPWRSDLSALRSDWLNMGGDFRVALDRHELERSAMLTQQEAVRLAARDSLMGMILGALIAFGGIAAALFSFLRGAPWMLSAAFLSLPLMIVAVELIRRKH